MATIEERAREYARKTADFHRREYAAVMMYSKRDFIAGAKSEREELLRWRDPKTEMPEELQSILIKYKDGNSTHIGMGCVISAFGITEWNIEHGLSLTSIPAEDVIGWRPIEELE